MPAPTSYDYALIRVVPSLERGEFVNVGVVLHARQASFLGARIGLDEARLRALAPDVDLPAVREHLASIERIAAGGPDTGEIGALDRSGRFHWLVSPRSTIIQVSPVHSGLCEDPAAELDRLFGQLVASPG